MSEFKVFDLPGHRDSRGQLVVLEQALPFVPCRVFWITGSDGQLRGGHRHHRTRQALVAVAGRVVVAMHDGRHRDSITLEAPNRCLLVEPDDWHTMAFGPGAILLVFASTPYDRNDYIDEDYP